MAIEEQRDDTAPATDDRAGVPRINLHAIELRSRANGPGVRAVLWFQGCSLACPGCYNPGTHDRARPPGPPSPDGRGVWSVDALVARIRAEEGAIEGISVSGGEPLEQADALLALLAEVRAQTGLSILLFSGYTIEEIQSLALGPAILGCVDVLVDGRYVADRRIARGLRGSANQRIHLLTPRYCMEDVTGVPEAEIRIGTNGEVVVTGIDPPRVK